MSGTKTGWRRKTLGNKRDLESTRPVDCTKELTPLSDLPDRIMSPQDAARQVFGKDYNDLPRMDQRKIDVVIDGRAKELKQQFEFLRKTTALTAMQRLEGMHRVEDAAVQLMDILSNDAVKLCSDNMDVTADPTGHYKKTPAGTARRNLRHCRVFFKTRKLYVDTTIALAKLGEDPKQATTFIKEDNRQVVMPITPQGVTSRLGKFGKGEVVDQNQISADIDESEPDQG